MLKRIYTLLISGTLLSIQASYAAPQTPTNIKKIITKKDKIIVIVRENGKDKEIVLTKEQLETLKKTDTKKLSKKASKGKSVKKSNTKEKKELVSKKDTTKKTATTKVKEKLKKGQYRVVSGDTFFSIARKLKVSLSDLTKLNKTKGKTLIHPGDIIKIPGNNFEQKAQKAVATNKKTVYKVKRGDTIYSIAKKYNMKVTTLKKMNNLIPHPKLKPGMELTVLGKAVDLKKRKTPIKHTVKRGETIWTISRRYNLSIYELRLLNPKIKTRSLRVGSVLKISKKAALKLVKTRKSKKYKKRSKRLSGVLARYQKRGSSSSSRNVVAYAKRFLGTRYVWGASRPGAFDCSGFTQYVMRHAKGRTIPRVSRRQAYYGRYITRRNLRAGDLIFFDTSHRRRGYVNHVGIYIGNGKFIHASSGKHRVVITSLSKPFYRQRFMWGRRVR
ncbi:MAG TPA: LysM peptidoglycan-binding domain-containing protein [Nitratifractor sp.]|nr:LysM peptidoglycan-binding domain-containing protein [Nitratifractor sp.]